MTSNFALLISLLIAAYGMPCNLYWPGPATVKIPSRSAPAGSNARRMRFSPLPRTRRPASQ
eukprot:4950710-Alexandrium_andersonii.AAC.1